MSDNTPSQQTNSPKKTPVHQWIIGIICIIIGLCVVGGLMAKSWHDAKVHQRKPMRLIKRHTNRIKRR